jgi:hypothetical protein
MRQETPSPRETSEKLAMKGQRKVIFDRMGQGLPLEEMLVLKQPHFSPRESVQPSPDISILPRTCFMQLWFNQSRAFRVFFQLMLAESGMIRELFLKRKPPHTQRNGAHELENCFSSPPVSGMAACMARKGRRLRCGI